MATTPKRKLVVEVPKNFTDRDVHKLLRLAAACERATRLLEKDPACLQRLNAATVADDALLHNIDTIARRDRKGR